MSNKNDDDYSRNTDRLIQIRYNRHILRTFSLIGSVFVFFVVCLNTYFSVPVLAQEYIFETKWGSSGTSYGSFSQPQGLAVESQGNVYVTDFTGLANQVQKFTGDGVFLTAWGFLGF